MSTIISTVHDARYGVAGESYRKKRQLYTLLVVVVSMLAVPLLHGYFGLMVAGVIVMGFSGSIFALRAATPSGMVAGVAGGVVVYAEPHGIAVALGVCVLIALLSLLSTWWPVLEAEAGPGRTRKGRAQTVFLVVFTPALMTFISILFITWTLSRAGL